MNGKTFPIGTSNEEEVIHDTEQTQPRRQTAVASRSVLTRTRGKRIRIEPTRRQRVDPDMIALCYWLIAQRIVQEADDDREAGPSDSAERQ